MARIHGIGAMLGLVLLSACGSDGTGLTGPVRESLPLSGPIVPLTGPVEIVQTAYMPLTRQCQQITQGYGAIGNILLHGDNLRPPRTPRRCRVLTMQPLPNGAARTTVTEANWTRQFTRSATGDISDLALVGPAIEAMSSQERTDLLAEETAALQTGNLRRQTVRQGGDFLTLAGDPRQCRISGRSMIRDRAVIVADCVERDIHSGNLTVEGAAQMAVDIQTGLTLAQITRARLPARPSQPPERTNSMRRYLSLDWQ